MRDMDFENLSEKDKVKEQGKFISWLQDNGIYNPNYSFDMMYNMHIVWRKMQSELTETIQDHHEFLAGEDL